MLWCTEMTDVSTRFLLFQVMLSGHISPGVFAQAKGISWYYPIFNVRFLDLLQNYSDVITSTIFGHEHTDGFRVVYSKQGQYIVFGYKHTDGFRVVYSKQGQYSLWSQTHRVVYNKHKKTSLSSHAYR